MMKNRAIKLFTRFVCGKMILIREITQITKAALTEFEKKDQQNFIDFGAFEYSMKVKPDYRMKTSEPKDPDWEQL
jgi:hypothetical protein